MLQPKLPPVVSTKKRMRKSKSYHDIDRKMFHTKKALVILTAKKMEKDPDKAQEWLHDGWTSGW